ncbi:MAG: transcriptional repressor [Acidobacteriota bacterium]
MRELIERLRASAVQATPQRLAIAEYVLKTTDHPTAEEVWKRVRRRCPTLSRATVYNTLNLFTERGLLKSRTLVEGVVVFDPNVGRHHHFVDEETMTIYDIPWEALTVSGDGRIQGFEVREYQVVLRGRRRRS